MEHQYGKANTMHPAPLVRGWATSGRKEEKLVQQCEARILFPSFIPPLGDINPRGF